MTRVMVGDALVFENERLQRAHEPVLRPDRVAAAPEPAPGRRRAPARPHPPWTPARGVGADGLRRRPPAALCPLGFQAHPDRAPGRGAGVCRPEVPLARVGGRWGGGLCRRACRGSCRKSSGAAGGRLHLGKAPASARSACRCRRDQRRQPGAAGRPWSGRRRTSGLLGDLLHSVRARTGRAARRSRRWGRARASLPLTLVRGNHDRRAGDPPSAGHAGRRRASALGPWALVPSPRAVNAGYVVAGHLHPAVVVGGTGHRPPAPAVFSLRRGVGVLPAFGEFTGMHAVRAQPGDRVFAIAERRVHEV